MIRIDHRILIPTPPNFIWDYVSDLNQNPVWQVNCDSIVFLSQKQKGVGTRWRQRATNRQETVYEILTWYDGLGYEYTMIDGAVFKSLRGRIRLQEIAEGTIVQWTVDYELGGGMLGTLRNSLGIERRHDNLMRESLKTLWKEAKRSGSMENYQARSLLREGPNTFDERAQYVSRHSSSYQEELEEAAADNLEIAADTATIPEPPVSDEDTRPRPVTEATTTESSNAPSKDESSDLSRFAPPPNQSPEPIAEPYRPVEDVQPEPEPTKPHRDPAGIAPTPNVTSDPIEQAAPLSAAVETNESKTITPPSPAPSPTALPTATDESAAEMSIWEVFGIPSPTDTQKMRAIEAADEAEAEYKAEALQSDISEPGIVSKQTPNVKASTVKEGWSRAGLRNQLRTSRLKVRRPGK
jgi:uncharacterized membrane protein